MCALRRARCVVRARASEQVLANPLFDSPGHGHAVLIDTKVAARATRPHPCRPGSAAAGVGNGRCARCLAGTFQAAEGATACQPCTPGYYCTEGASAALPCPGGTTKPADVAGPLTSAEQCITCPKGTYCPVGSETAANCSAGTYNNQLRQESCIKCTPGTFQDAESATACQQCTPGYYCTEGASAALPCPGTPPKRRCSRPQL